MLSYIGRRLLIMVPLLVLISIVTFTIIQLPPGDYLTTVVARLSARGDPVSQSQLDALSSRYGLDEPVWVQYFKWIGGVLHGDFGTSFAWGEPVSTLLARRLPATVAIGVLSLLFTWAVGFPAGVYAAVRQHSIGDYVVALVGLVGIAVPGFLLALIAMWLQLRWFGLSAGGLFSPSYVDAPWSPAKVLDLVRHLGPPVVVLGAAGTAATVRYTRANLLDELHKPYVVAARARGLPERRLVRKYPLRVALIPFVATVGWVLPALVSGEVIVAKVLNLPTIGPLLVDSLKSQDMYLAGSIILITSTLTLGGTLLSDIALAWLDPRIRRRYR